MSLAQSDLSVEHLLSTKRSLRASINDGANAAVMIGAGESYLSAFGIFLRGTPLEIGTLAALPPFLGAIFQSAGVWLLDRVKTRRQAMVTATTLQALMWLPILLLAIFTPERSAVNWLIGFVIVYYASGGLATPLWSSLVGDLIPPEIRGRFFGIRSRKIGINTFVAVLIAGLILDAAEKRGHGGWGFALIFGVALVARLLSSYWLWRHDDPPFALGESDKFSFFKFLKRTRHSNFARFVFFFSVMNFGVNFGAPFFSVYILKVLNLSYFQFTMITAASVITQFLTLRHWGELTDRFGNKKIMNISSIGLAIVPFFWLLSPNPWILGIIQMYAGFTWAGYNLAAGNFLFDAVTPPKRGRCIAYQSMVNGAFVCAGSLAGGYLATHGTLPPFMAEMLPVPATPLLLVFLLSGLMRTGAAMVFLRLFKEVREVEAIPHRDLIFRITHLRPMAGASFGFMSGKNNGESKAPIEQPTKH